MLISGMSPIAANANNTAISVDFIASIKPDFKYLNIQKQDILLLCITSLYHLQKFMQLLWAWVYPDRDRPYKRRKKLVTLAIILKIGINWWTAGSYSFVIYTYR
jgi:hypothetical protein